MCLAEKAFIRGLSPLYACWGKKKLPKPIGSKKKESYEEKTACCFSIFTNTTILYRISYRKNKKNAKKKIGFRKEPH